MNIFKNFFQFHKKTEPEKTEETKNFMDIVVSLNKDYNIDVLVNIEDDNYSPLSETEYAIIISEFLNSSFGKYINTSIKSVLNEEIKYDQNKNLIEKINIMMSYKENQAEESNYIKPSSVFKDNFSQSLKNA